MSIPAKRKRKKRQSWWQIPIALYLSDRKKEETAFSPRLSRSFHSHSFLSSLIHSSSSRTHPHSYKTERCHSPTRTPAPVPSPSLYTQTPHNVILKTRRRRKRHPPLPRTLPFHYPLNFFNPIRPISSIRPRNRRNQLGLPLPRRDGPRPLW